MPVAKFPEGKSDAVVSCPLCHKRKPQRYCPAMGEKICAVCCGTEREVTIDCPPHCAHLAAAHRFEAEHRKVTLPRDDPFADEFLSESLIEEHNVLIVGLCDTILKFAAKHSAIADADILGAIQSLAETTRTAASGIIYEKPPDDPLRRDLYADLADLLVQLKEELTRAGRDSPKDSETFKVLVFLSRLVIQRSNGRPRSKSFLAHLQRQFRPLPEPAIEEPRILLP